MNYAYKKTKFNRERDQREALLKSLAESLIINQSIETTETKAKAVARYIEVLIGKAKKAKIDLHSRRQVIRGLNTLESAHKLVDELAPKLTKRNSGYLRITRTVTRRGDNAQMAKVSFVDDLKSEKKSQKSESAKTSEADSKDDKKTEVEQDTASLAKESRVQPSQPAQNVRAPKRSGVRGNR